jgi:hypothetical protein
MCENVCGSTILYFLLPEVNYSLSTTTNNVDQLYIRDRYKMITCWWSVELPWSIDLSIN